MALTTLSYILSVGIQASAAGAQQGTALAATQNNTSFTKRISLGTSVANAGAGGGDEAAAVLVTIANSGSTTVNMASLTNLIGQTSQNLARVKALSFQLLSTTDDSTNGTTCTYVTLGNNGANDFISVSGSGWFGTNTSTFDLANGSVMCWGTPSAAGSTVNSTRCLIKVANGDSGNSAAVQYTVAGASS